MWKLMRAIKGPERNLLRFAPLLLLLGGPASASDPCVQRAYEGDGFTVCAFDARAEDLRLVVGGAGTGAAPLRSFSALAAALGPDAARVRFAMNAGMFDDDGEAIGLLIENGRERHGLNRAKGPGNFHMLPNGVFAQNQDGILRIQSAATYAVHRNRARWATQSGPMLVIDGKLHPAIQDDGPSRLVRNGVGLRSAHEALFVISDGAVSFGKLARLFRDALGCPNALYFDGNVSSLWAPSLARIDAGAALGPMVVVLERR